MNIIEHAKALIAGGCHGEVGVVPINTIASLLEEIEGRQQSIDGAAEALIGDGCEFDPTSVGDELAPYVSPHLQKDLPRSVAYVVSASNEMR